MFGLSVAIDRNIILGFALDQASYYAGFVNNYLNEVADSLAEKAVPYIKKGYKDLGDRAAHFAAETFDKETEKWVQEKWTDPFSTEQIHAVCKTVEKISKKIATKQPTENKYLEFLDKSCMEIAHEVHNYTKHTDRIFEAGASLNKKLDEYSFEKWIEKPRGFFGPTWWIVSGSIGLLRKAFFSMVWAVLVTIEYFRSYFSYAYRPKVLEASKNILKEVTKHPTEPLALVTKNYLKRENTKIRKEIVENVVKDVVLDKGLKQVSRVAVKAAAGALTYYRAVKPMIEATGIPNPSFSVLDTTLALGTVYAMNKNGEVNQQTLTMAAAFFGYYYFLKPAMGWLGVPDPSIDVLDSVAAAGVATAVWQCGIKPVLEPYYARYSDAFNHSTSSFLDFCRGNDFLDVYPFVRRLEKALFGRSEDN